MAVITGLDQGFISKNILYNLKYAFIHYIDRDSFNTSQLELVIQFKNYYSNIHLFHPINIKHV